MEVVEVVTLLLQQAEVLQEGALNLVVSTLETHVSVAAFQIQPR